MYKAFYQLKENPFNVTADPDFFFSSQKHQEAFSHLLYGIQERKGIIVITGEIGTGKTTICKALLNRLDNKNKTALILNPNFSNLQLFQLIINDFGIQGEFKNKYDLINALNKFLLEESSKGNNVIIIIDEAQNLSAKQLEQVRLLSNLETEKDKLLQIILVGQPELCDKLKLFSLRQLNQRVAVRYHITPLAREEIEAYIFHRLNLAKLPEAPRPRVQFTKQAIDLIFEKSAGTPRMINVLCDRALLAGMIAETYVIDQNIVNQCIEEVMIK